MNEPDEMTCADFAAVAAELALGVLTGRERAVALEHLDRCDACRENLRQLSLAGDELLSLLPAIEPPPGFETRVLDRLGIAASGPGPGTGPGPGSRPQARAGGGHRRRPGRAGITGLTRRTLAAAAVVLAVLGAALGGWGVRAATTHPASSSLRSAALLSAGQLAVGKVFLYNGSPRWVYMSVYLESAKGPVTCELVGQDGRVTRLGTFWMSDGYGAWGSPDPVDDGPITAARLVSANGTVLATARFS
jgi:hypothetical protein